ncbi:protein PSK SIMULATOR 3-like [Gastrolobium bilobum]|uniref:protein PSK SIMULATOR 3-like n=1 Tax=Gastrolobium bilobum TaxID=150636 RepID=UPI002AB0BCD1|nr:protein PSK SIMULATOR 3-like [Gastrolobium bilobum]XP_061349342.1 protein PSK SIMULATOR 3-like [Gastrolobium bilobum]
MVAESWFRSLWKTPRKDDTNSEKVVIGVLTFEIARLMSKLVNLWQSLSDKQVSRLREEIRNSVGIRKLVSEDEIIIVRLISSEMLENMAHVAESVARIGKKCSDPSLKGFENAIDEFITLGIDPYGWGFTFKKMEKKVKRMEKFISANASLHQEMEVLADLEQTVRRMKAYCDSDGENLIDYQKKVAWKRLEVKNLKDNSLWNRTYDYAVNLLARSLFTIFSRINNVFGIQEIIDVGKTKSPNVSNSDYIHGSQSVSELLQSSVHPSENNVARFASGPLGAVTAKSGPNVRTNKASIFRSGGDSSTKQGLTSGKNRSLNFFSGPLGRNLKKSVPDNGTNKNSKFWKFHGHSTNVSGKEIHSRHNRLTQVGPFKGSMAVDSSSVTDCHSIPISGHLRTQNHKDDNSNILTTGKVVHCTQSIFSSLCKLKPPSESLGAASLALHYANVIIVIERLAASPYLIGLDARDDLYNMLPGRVRTALRTKLKPYSKGMASAVYDASLAEEWTEAMTSILEWLAPLAHNMLRWQSERSYEQQSFVSRTNVLLVQTLYFAKQEETEAIITELLVGLNYVWRYVRELNTKALIECGSSGVHNRYPQLNG